MTSVASAPLKTAAVFRAERVDFTYPGSRVAAIRALSWVVERGGVSAIIGGNGSGKSTLLKLLLNVLRPAMGRVLFEDREVREWDRRELALRIGVVSQIEELAFPITVRELVSLGRYPHLGPWRRAGLADREAVTRAMERCEVAQLADRLMATLSGGERQRARLARALAQEPDTLVLDEPTAALDIAHEMSIFELLGGLAARERTTVVLVTHHVNLAARYADRLLLLDGGRIAAQGAPADVLTRQNVEAAYGWPVNVFPHPGPGRDTGAPQVAPLADPARTHLDNIIDRGDRLE